MNNNDRLSDYLKTNFPGLVLESPLFYSTPIGIRFELGCPYRGIDSPNYFENLILRASSIFEELFKETDDIFVVVKTYESVEPYVCLNYEGELVFEKYLINTDLVPSVDSIEVERLFEENGDLSGITYQHSLLCQRKDIDYNGIFEGIAHCDHAIKPYINAGVFFINIKNNVILYMYDDRGMDVISDSKSHLIGVYKKYSDWILDYDRERINKTFEGDRRP